MPVISRFLWVMVVILFVLAIYTSITQNEEATGPDTAYHTGYSQNPSDTRPVSRGDTPIADDPPIPVQGQTQGQTGSGGADGQAGSDVSQIVAEIDSIVPMSIDDAYAAIPHKRTTYQASQARISRTESEYLEQLFALTDQMTAARVSALTQLYYGYGGMSVAQYNQAYDRAMDGFAQLQAPRPAIEAHRQIVKAVTEQHDFLNDWENASASEKDRIKQNYGRNAKVQSSHKRLLSAYGILMRAYGHDGANNKTSFYDHLCALDFI